MSYKEKHKNWDKLKARRQAIMDKMLPGLSEQRQKAFKETFRWFWHRGTRIELQYFLVILRKTLEEHDIIIEERVFMQNLQRFIKNNKSRIDDYKKFEDGRVRNKAENIWLAVITNEFLQEAKNQNWIK